MPVISENIPEVLKWERRWLNWRWENRKGKWNKPPLRTDGTYGDAANPQAWVTYDEAYEAYQQNSTIDGIGFALGDGFSGVDLDDCRDPDSSVITEQAGSIITTFDSYTEISPSGTGVKILVRGVKPDGACKSPDGSIEVYSSGRYFTVTAIISKRRLSLLRMTMEHWRGSLMPTWAI